jgi:hypothetical protein
MVGLSRTWRVKDEVGARVRRWLLFRLGLLLILRPNPTSRDSLK